MRSRPSPDRRRRTSYSPDVLHFNSRKCVVTQLSAEDNDIGSGEQSTNFPFQSFDFFFNQIHRSMFGQINLVHRNTEDCGHLLGCPFFVHIQVEDLKLLRVKPSFDFCDGSVKQILFPFNAPQRIQVLARRINHFVYLASAGSCVFESCMTGNECVRIDYWCVRPLLKVDGMSMITPHEFETLLPLAFAWAAEQERTILQSGVALTKSQLSDASLIGVVQPERVRLLRVAQIPTPADPALAAVVTAAGFISPVTAGLAVRYGIFIRDNCWEQRHILVHLLVHVMQYERLGGFAGFLRPYLFECIAPPGYPHGPMEREAFATSVRLCG
jgi:hypothetical protein